MKTDAPAKRHLTCWRPTRKADIPHRTAGSLMFSTTARAVAGRRCSPSASVRRDECGSRRAGYSSDPAWSPLLCRGLGLQSQRLSMPVNQGPSLRIRSSRLIPPPLTTYKPRHLSVTMFPVRKNSSAKGRTTPPNRTRALARWAFGRPEKRSSTKSSRPCSNPHDTTDVPEFWPMFHWHGLHRARRRRVTALKSRQPPAVAVRGLIIGIGPTCPRLPMPNTNAATACDLRSCQHLEPRDAIGAMFYASFLALVLHHHLRQPTTGGSPHGSCVGRQDGYTAGAAATQIPAAPTSFRITVLLAATDGRCSGAGTASLLYRPCGLLALVLKHRPQGHQTHPPFHLLQALIVSLR